MASNHPTLLCRYRYDPLDRLIDQSQAEMPTQQRFYCKSRLATEIHGAMQHTIFQHGDLLLVQQQRQGDLVSATLLATDLQRSILHSIEKNHQQQSIAYSPYGHRHPANGLHSLLGFNGERIDPVTGHYLLGNGYRAFNPVLMRFTSPDDLSPFGKGGMNSYAYCLGDPMNQIDPTGNIPLMITRLWRMASVRIQDWRVNRLSRKNAKISKAMNKQVIENFKQLYTETLEAYKNAPVYLDNPPTLFNIAYEALPPQARTLNYEKHPMLRISPIKYHPQRIELKADLEHFVQIANRDSSGAISGFEAGRLEYKFNDKVYSNLTNLRENFRSNHEKILRIRGVDPIWDRLTNMNFL